MKKVDFYDDSVEKNIELTTELENHRKDYLEKKMNRAEFRVLLNKLGAQSAALKWSIGENDRYD